MRKIVMEEMGGNRDLPSVEYMRVAIPRLVQQDAVVILPDWQMSANAKTEVGIALTFRMKFFNQYGDEIEAPASVIIERKS